MKLHEFASLASDSPHLTELLTLFHSDRRKRVWHILNMITIHADIINRLNYVLCVQLFFFLTFIANSKRLIDKDISFYDCWSKTLATNQLSGCVVEVYGLWHCETNTTQLIMMLVFKMWVDRAMFVFFNFIYFPFIKWT